MSSAPLSTSRASWKRDLQSGFLVFLIALPLCLGIAMASGFPPVSGVLTAIVGGLVATFLGSARLTIKGPAAGLIVIAISAVQELGQGDLVAGYHRTLAVGMVAAGVQILFGVFGVGMLGALMPSSVVHGMLSAIGVIIVAKQIHLVFGVVPDSGSPLALLAEVPKSLMHANPEVLLIGFLGLVLLFLLPKAPWSFMRRIPAPLIVLLVSVPLGLTFDFDHQHSYWFAAHEYIVGPTYLVSVPDNLLGAIQMPDFSMLTSAASLKYVVMFALVGSVESVLSMVAVDSLDPAKRASDPNKDLLAVGVGNLISAGIGGLPMISEIVRSKANIDNGAQSRLSNFFHGAFLLAFVALVPAWIHEIPMAALAAMLVFTGLRLASFQQVAHAYAIGRDQLLVFATTMVATLWVDLLVGVGVGLVLEVVLHIARGASLKSLVRASFEERRQGSVLRLEVHGPAMFSNFLGLMRRLRQIESDVSHVVLDLSNCSLVDHTVLERVHTIADEWPSATLELEGLGEHRRASSHALAARWLPAKGS